MRVHSAAVGGKVSITVRGDEFQPLLLCPVDPLFELPGLPCEAVEVPANDRVDLAALKGRHHRVVVGAVHVLLRRGDRLIDVGMHDVPAALLGKGFAVLALPVDGEAVHGSIERDTEGNSSTCSHTLFIAHLGYIETKLHHVAVLHHVVFAFQA